MVVWLKSLCDSLYFPLRTVNAVTTAAELCLRRIPPRDTFNKNNNLVEHDHHVGHEVLTSSLLVIHVYVYLS